MKMNRMNSLIEILLACVMLLTGAIAFAEEPAATEQSETSVHPSYAWPLLESAASIRIGRDGQTEYSITMYDHDASATMLNYLTDRALLFPTYTYEGEIGFVAQSIRGTYSRDDEIAIADIHAGEVYLFSGNQLRLYFKDVIGANITATPVGYVEDTETLAEAVETAYTNNLGDMWGVDVYFWLTRTME